MPPKRARLEAPKPSEPVEPEAEAEAAEALAALKLDLPLFKEQLCGLYGKVVDGVVEEEAEAEDENDDEDEDEDEKKPVAKDTKMQLDPTKRKEARELAERLLANFELVKNYGKYNAALKRWTVTDTPDEDVAAIKELLENESPSMSDVREVFMGNTVSEQPELAAMF
jgi:hypothetical protein